MVHYSTSFGNAFWSPSLGQMVFGDGDGVYWGNFAKAMDVTAHELTHAVTQYSSNLVYSGESGGLNEAMRSPSVSVPQPGPQLFGLEVQHHIAEPLGAEAMQPILQHAALCGRELPAQAPLEQVRRGPRPWSRPCLSPWRGRGRRSERLLQRRLQRLWTRAAGEAPDDLGVELDPGLGHTAAGSGPARWRQALSTRSGQRRRGISRRESDMQCMHCRGEMKRAHAPFSVDRNGYHVHWDALPAWVCEQCGEPYFEPAEVARIQRALAALDREIEAA